MRGCKENNPFAQKMFFNRYGESMMILCLRYVVNPEDAKEVLMDGFFSFFKKIDTFTYMGEGSVKAWLKKIVVNQCLMHLRKTRRLAISGEGIEQYENSAIEAEAAHSLNTKEIMKLVHAMPDGYRTVFNLFVFEGMNHKEIGELLSISENTSRTQLHKARVLLKKQLTQLN